jgi:hypothetical protein
MREGCPRTPLQCSRLRRSTFPTPLFVNPGYATAIQHNESMTYQKPEIQKSIGYETKWI